MHLFRNLTDAREDALAELKDDCKKFDYSSDMSDVDDLEKVTFICMFLKKNVIISLEEYIYILKKVLKYLSDDCTLCCQKNFSKSRPTCTFNTQTTARRGIF